MALNTTAAESGLEYCSATAFNANTPKDSDYFFHDNGATKSVFHDRALFRLYDRFETPVNVNGYNSGHSAPAPAGGVVRVDSIVDGKKFTLDITDALHVPTARVNLISGSALDKKGVTTVTRNGKIELSKNGQVFAVGSLWKGLYRLNFTPVRFNNAVPSTSHSLLSRIEPAPLIQRLSDSPMSAALQAMNAASEKTDFYTA
jgi:hypothetical protein